jgi:DNA polymerase-3 subunit gamma/tau
MSYQVLARKWRPATFEQMVGQSHVLHALTNALTQQRLHHAYLFSGTRGVGKTSLARLFAKGLNCEQGVTATPCGQCSSCIEISEGRFVDLIEVDAASRTKVDDTRELLDNVQYRPSRGRFKVYLIDEVHMLSRSSFNALLKTLEEPPEHVKFLLATTDPQRLPVTVLSRCLQFNLKSLTQGEITQQLDHVLTEEVLPFDDQALSLLAKAANGSMRDALSLTDQAIAFGGGEVRLTQVQTMLGCIDERHVITLFNALTQGDIEQLMQVTSQVLSFGADPQEVLRSLLELLHQITLSQFAPAAAQLSIHSEQIKFFAAQLNPDQVQLYYQLLLTGRKDLPHAPDPKSGLEMALLRAVSFVPEAPVKRWIVDKTASVSLPEFNTVNSGNSISSAEEQSPALTNELITSPAQVVEKKSDVVTLESAQVSKSIDSSEEQVASLEAVDDEDTALDSLNSEQTLILSQAASHGMEQETTQFAAQTSQAEVDEPVVEQADVENAVVQSDPNAVPDEYYAQAAQFDVEQDYQEQHQEPFHEQFEAESAHPYTESSDSDAYSPANKIDATRDESPASSREDDDILDAVLAARDSLLTQLSAEEPKESGGKKPEAERKDFVPPKRTASTALSQEERLTGDNKPIDNTAIDKKPSAIEAESNSAGLEDRPPWEEPVTPVITEEEVVSDASFNQIAELNDAAIENDLALEDSPAVKGSFAARDQLATRDCPSSRDNSAQVAAVSKPALRSDLVSAHDGTVTGNDIDLKWYRLMSALDVGGRVRQLAVNSVCHHFVEPLALLLKPNQKHLSADLAVVQLEEALGRALEKEVHVSISVGVDAARETPLEIRQRFHQELLSQAHDGLMNDAHIQWLMAEMDAEFEADSLSYSPELLSLKGNTIELVDKSNFKTLPES